MSTDPKPGGPFELHCDNCVHLSRKNDWKRPAYCTYHEREVEIRIGDICSQFRERDDATEEGVAAGVDQVSEDLHIEESETLAGLTGPFFAVYDDEEMHGWYCSTCEGVDVAADPMGRLKCDRCGNVHRSHQWDSAYL